MDFIIDFWLTNPVLMGGTLLLLMFLNIHLLKEGFQLRNLGHNQFFNQEFYVVDPAIRKIFETKSYPLKLWIKWLFFLIAAIFSSTLLMLKDTLPLSLLGDVGELCLGVIFCRYFQLILNHLENRFLFLDVINHSEDLRGQITFSKSFLYTQIRIIYVSWGIMWLVLFVLVGHLFFLGGILGTLIQIHFISKWEKQDS